MTAASPAASHALAVAASLGGSATLRERLMSSAWADHARHGRPPDLKALARRFGLPRDAARAHVLALMGEGLWPPRPAVEPDPPVYGPPTPPWVLDGCPSPDQIAAASRAMRDAWRAGRFIGKKARPGLSRLAERDARIGVVSGLRRDKRGESGQ